MVIIKSKISRKEFVERHSEGAWDKLLGNNREQDSKEKNRERARKYYQEHKEKIIEYGCKYYQEHKEEKKEEHKEYSRKYYQEHKEEKKEYARKYCQEHKEELNEKRREYKKLYYRKYREDNKEQWNEYQKQYQEQYLKTQAGRSIVLSSSYKLSDKNKGFDTSNNITGEWILDNIFNGQKCYYCGDSDWTHLGADRIDNSRPHTPENCIPCCGICNAERNDRYSVEEFKRYRDLHPRNLGGGIEKSWEVVEKNGIKVIKKK